MFKPHQWRAIQDLISRMLAQQGKSFIVDVVTKRDDNRKLVWVESLGDTPCRIVAFDYKVKYYDTRPTGNAVSGSPVQTKIVPVTTKEPKGTVREVSIITPQKGDTVMVALHLNSRNLPYCIGVVQSTGVIPSGD